LRLLIAGGTGFIGQALVEHRLKFEDTITVLGRNNKKTRRVFSTHPTIKAMSWHELNREGAKALSHYDCIINLTGKNIGGLWTKKSKQSIIDSRIIPTKTLAQYCAKLGEKAPTLINANGASIYGLQDTVPNGLPPAMDENSEINLDDSFLAKVAREWERATQVAKDAGCRVVITRFGVVLGAGSKMLKSMRIPYFFCLGGPLGSGNQPMAWIALDDLLSALDFIIEKKEITGPINFVSPNTITQKEFAKAFAHALHRPAVINLPESFLRFITRNNQMIEELILKGQHVKPKRLLDAGFKFKYPDILSALQRIYGK